MFCPQCGFESNEVTNTCTRCGFASQTEEVPNVPMNETKSTSFGKPHSKKKRSWIAIALVVMFLGYSAYTSFVNEGIDMHNTAIESYLEGDVDTARKNLEEAAEKALPGHTKGQILMTLAQLEATEGNQRVALLNFEKAKKELDKGSVEYILVSGEIEYYDGNPSEAEEYYLEALEKYPDDPRVHNALALFYLDVEGWYSNYFDAKKALMYAKSAYDLTSRGDYMYDTVEENLIVAYIVNGEGAEALNHLLFVDYDARPYMYVLLAMAYTIDGNITEAQKALDEAVRKGIITNREADNVIEGTLQQYGN